MSQVCQIKLMHWNILSDYRAKWTFEGIIDETILDWSNRSFLIQEHIKYVNPDVLGLCDIDTGGRHKFLSQFICSQGYKEFHKENMNLGVSIFYKTDIFELIEKNYYPYETKKKA